VHLDAVLTCARLLQAIAAMRRGASKETDCAIALKPENASRNRYRDILPCM
jgi:hypothetical protein